jgi:hypothetical protein
MPEARLQRTRDAYQDAPVRRLNCDLQGWIAGKGHSIWRTQAEADASWTSPNNYDGIKRTPFEFLPWP